MELYHDLIQMDRFNSGLSKIEYSKNSDTSTREPFGQIVLDSLEDLTLVDLIRFQEGQDYDIIYKNNEEVYSAGWKVKRDFLTRKIVVHKEINTPRLTQFIIDNDTVIYKTGEKISLERVGKVDIDMITYVADIVHNKIDTIINHRSFVYRRE